MGWVRVVSIIPASLDIEELFDALLVVVHELSQVVELSHQFCLLVDIFRSCWGFGLIVLLRFLLTVFFQLSLENLHLSLEFIKQLLKIII